MPSQFSPERKLGRDHGAPKGLEVETGAEREAP